MGELIWGWLSEPLALDFANTVHWHGTEDVDHLVTIDGVLEWLGYEPHALPDPGELDEESHEQLLSLRDASRRTFRALAAGEAVRPGDIETINETARMHPTIQCVDPITFRRSIEPAAPGINVLNGFLAATVITLLTDPDEVARLAFCTAPNCGGLFRQSRPNQKWCHPDCGARARADRQYRRGSGRKPA